jgi:hypothetical protein
VQQHRMACLYVYTYKLLLLLLVLLLLLPLLLLLLPLMHLNGGAPHGLFICLYI